MNRFELRLRPYSEEEIEQGGEMELPECPEIWVDGQLLDEPRPVDPRGLMSSLIRPGEHFIFNCQCGMPECASIYRGFEVRHEGERIRWRFRRPVSQHGFDSDEDYLARATLVEYVFARSDFADFEAMEWYQRVYPYQKRATAIWALAQKAGLTSLDSAQYEEFGRRIEEGDGE